MMYILFFKYMFLCINSSFFKEEMRTHKNIINCLIVLVVFFQILINLFLLFNKN